MKKIIILLFLTGCGSNFLSENDPSADLNNKLSQLKSPVVVVSKGSALGEDCSCKILVKDSVGTVKVLYCKCFESLQKGDTIK